MHKKAGKTSIASLFSFLTRAGKGGDRPLLLRRSRIYTYILAVFTYESCKNSLIVTLSLVIRNADLTFQKIINLKFTYHVDCSEGQYYFTG